MIKKSILNYVYYSSCMMNGTSTPSRKDNQSPFTAKHNSATKLDKQLKATLDLKEISARLLDVVNELKTCCSLFSKDSMDVLTRPQKSFIASLKSTIIPFIAHASNEISLSSKVLAPICSTQYVHNSDEAKRKRKAIDDIENSNTKKRKSESLKRIEHTIMSRTALMPITNGCSQRKAHHRAAKTNKSKQLPTRAQALLPKPLNGKQFTPEEFISMFENIDKPKTRSLFINHAVETSLVPMKRCALYCLLNRAADKKNIRNHWQHVGRGSLLDYQHLDELHLELTKCNGLTIDKNDIKKKCKRIKTN